MLTETELLESPDLIPLDFCLWVWLKSEVDERNVDAGVEVLAGT
jgi:hypothetical protein